MPQRELVEKRRGVKLWQAVVGGVGALAVGFLSGVGSSVGDHVLAASPVVDGPSPTSSASPGCPGLGIGAGRLGEETLTLLIRKSEDDCWTNTVTDLRPGDRLFVNFQYINLTGSDAEDATIVGWLSDGLAYVPGSTTVKNTSNPDRKTISDKLFDPGINIGNYTNGSNAFVRFELVYQGSRDCGLQTEIVAVRFQSEDTWQTAGVLNQIPCLQSSDEPEQSSVP